MTEGTDRLNVKDPFTLTPENVYHTPSKPGVYILGTDTNQVVRFGRSEKSLSEELKNYLPKNGDVTRFWYSDTWSQETAEEM